MIFDAVVDPSLENLGISQKQPFASDTRGHNSLDATDAEHSSSGCQTALRQGLAVLIDVHQQCMT